MTEKFAEATPRPWVVENTTTERPYIRGYGGAVVAKTYRDSVSFGALPGEANASLIVEAVNNYERLVANLAKAHEALEECWEYFDQRADADQPPGDAYPTPNEEMKLLTMVEETLPRSPRYKYLRAAREDTSHD